MSIKFIQDFFGYSSANTQPPSPENDDYDTPFGFIDYDYRRKKAKEANKTYLDGVPPHKCSHDRKVSFFDGLVTGVCDPPPLPFGQSDNGESLSNETRGPTPELILSEYRKACKDARTQPIESVEKQIACMHQSPRVRQELLSLKGKRLTYADMEALEGIFNMVQFDSLDFEYTFLDDESAILLFDYLQYYNSATKLNLSFNRNLASRAVKALYQAIRGSDLQMLNLRYTSIESSFVTFANSLREFPSPCLTSLHLENLKLSGSNLSTLMKCLKPNNVLKELFIGENELKPSDTVEIYDFLLGNKTLQMLDLRNNKIGDYGFKQLCDALKHRDTVANSALSALVVWKNMITHNSMDNLALVLKVNKHLETINIGENEIGLEGISRLKPALAGNSNLHRLGLQKTEMNNEAVIVLAECLAENSVMIRVDLRDNPGIGSAGFLALYSAMKINTTITCLNIDKDCSNPASEKVRPYQEEFKRYYNEIKACCDRNREAALQRLTVRTADNNKGDGSKSEDEHTDTEGTKIDGNQQDENGSTQKKLKSRFYRSTSLTCQETITDIPERIRQMSGSTHSLDDTPKAKPKKPNRFKIVKISNEWGSLPAISQAVENEVAAAAEKPVETTPVVKKIRRFSVSPTVSTFNVSPEDLNHLSALATVRPHTLSINIPVKSDDTGPSSAPTNSILQQLIDESQHVAKPIVSTPVNKLNHLLDLFKRQDENRAGSSNLSTVSKDEARETDVRTVVTDLVNYIVYEEDSQAQRKISMLLGTTFTPSPSDSNAASTPERIVTSLVVSTPETPTRFSNIAEELSGDETEEEAVQSVVRGMVREVLKSEKEQLRQTLENRRKNRGSQMPPSLP